MIGYGRTLVGAAVYDPASGIALFPLPSRAAELKTGKQLLTASAADFQESKNVDSVGDELLPNTAFASGNIRIVNRPTITWITPEVNECTARQAPLLVLASSPVAPARRHGGRGVDGGHGTRLRRADRATSER